MHAATSIADALLENTLAVPYKLSLALTPHHFASNRLFCFFCSCRQCSSGLQAIADVAAAIKAGYYSVGLAAGVTCCLDSALHANKILCIAAAVVWLQLLWQKAALYVVQWPG
jgi:hypothetical protein